MKSIIITPEIKAKCPELVLGSLSCKVVWKSEDVALAATIANTCNRLQQVLETPAINQLAPIAAARQGYKALGKDPSRYRLSAEALLRRVVKGKGLYQINNIVDTLNLISIDSGYSIGGYDVDKINGAIQLGIGEEGEPYEGIGRGTLNIANLPVFRDDLGAFGTPTSDSTRTMVTDKTERFLMIFLDFGNDKKLSEVLEKTALLYEKYAQATSIETRII